VIHWLDGEPTDMSNLVPLCEPHHLGQHNGEMAITGRGDGTFTFTRPNGRPYLAALPDLIDQESFLRTEPSIDDHYAVALLAHRRDRARNRTTAS
jgi:hypothetical protein